MEVYTWVRQDALRYMTDRQISYKNESLFERVCVEWVCVEGVSVERVRVKRVRSW